MTFLFNVVLPCFYPTSLSYSVNCHFLFILHQWFSTRGDFGPQWTFGNAGVVSSTTEIISHLFITVSSMPTHDKLEIITFLVLFSFVFIFDAMFSGKKEFYHFLTSFSRWTMTSREYQSCWSGSWGIGWVPHQLSDFLPYTGAWLTSVLQNNHKWLPWTLKVAFY